MKNTKNRNSENLTMPVGSRLLSRAEFSALAAVPAESEWLVNIENPNTRRAYRRDVKEFIAFVGIETPDDFRTVARAHVIAWQESLSARQLSAATIRRKLSAIASLFDSLCDGNAIALNPTHGVTRPSEGTYEGKTSALGEHEAKALLAAPPLNTLKDVRDRAILATYLFHGLRATELATLTPSAIGNREGVPHLRVLGKRSKIRFLPFHPLAQRLVGEYLELAGHGDQREGPLFRSVRSAPGRDTLALDQKSLFRNVIQHWALRAGLETTAVSNHAMRATAATNALAHGADIAKVQEWLGHSNVSTTKLYDRRNSQPEDRPTFRVQYD